MRKGWEMKGWYIPMGTHVKPSFLGVIGGLKPCIFHGFGVQGYIGISASFAIYQPTKQKGFNMLNIFFFLPFVPWVRMDITTGKGNLIIISPSLKYHIRDSPRTWDPPYGKFPIPFPYLCIGILMGVVWDFLWVRVKGSHVLGGPWKSHWS